MLWFYELIDLVLIILDLNLAEVVLLPNLLELNWRNNKLEGSIPSDFKLFGALYSLDLSGNLLNALLQALGDRKGINRFGDFSAPLDEALIHISLDLSGRPHLSYNLDIPTQRVGTYDAQ
ncbi:hypothetical protein S83_025514, partial [Arachis hypogaea]